MCWCSSCRACRCLSSVQLLRSGPASSSAPTPTPVSPPSTPAPTTNNTGPVLLRVGNGLPPTLLAQDFARGVLFGNANRGYVWSCPVSLVEQAQQTQEAIRRAANEKWPIGQDGLRPSLAEKGAVCASLMPPWVTAVVNAMWRGVPRATQAEKRRVFWQRLCPFVDLLLSTRVSVRTMSDGYADTLSLGVFTQMKVDGSVELPELRGVLTPINKGEAERLERANFAHSIAELPRNLCFAGPPARVLRVAPTPVADRQSPRLHRDSEESQLQQTGSTMRLRQRYRDAPPPPPNKRLKGVQAYIVGGPISLLNHACAEHSTVYQFHSYTLSVTQIANLRPTEPLDGQKGMWRAAQTVEEGISEARELTICYDQSGKQKMYPCALCAKE